MKSFGIWYKESEAEEKDNSEQSSEFKVDLHINLWNIESNETEKIDPFIDFGLSVINFRKVQEIQFLFPFAFDGNEFEDLYDKVRDSEIARLIFNDNDCDTSSHKYYFYIKNMDDKLDKVIFRLKKNDQFEDTVSVRTLEDNKEEYSILKISFDKIKEDVECKDFQHLYIRFRITSSKLKEMLFCNVKKKNLFLESGFVSTQIVDLKINKERNIPRDICEDMRMNKYSYIKFDKIHFLIMDQANNEVSILGNDFIECRKLEENDWDGYLNGRYRTEDVLVYHWKRSAGVNSGEAAKEYGKLVKISTSTTDKKIILSYVGIVILLGTAGNIVFYFLSSLLDKFFH